MRSRNALHICEEAAMPRIGVRELKTRASEVTHDVHENHVRYTITNRGEPLAIIIPYTPADEVATSADPHEEFRSLRALIAKGQKEPFSAVDLMREHRR
jgi:prevent-host-death family protein